MEMTTCSTGMQMRTSQFIILAQQQFSDAFDLLTSIVLFITSVTTIASITTVVAKIVILIVTVIVASVTIISIS
jgi:hypothetical protein